MQIQITLFFPKQVTPLFKPTILFFFCLCLYNITTMKPWIFQITLAHCLSQSGCSNCKVSPVNSLSVLMIALS